MAKVMVTGGAGFIGSHIADLFIEQGHDVCIVDDLSTGRESNLNPKAKFYEADICDVADMYRIFGIEKPEIVCHQAAQMSVRISVADPLFDAKVNVLGSLNLLECAKEEGVQRFIFASTGAVYGDAHELPCAENHPIEPLCQYGVSKYTFEHYLRLYYQLHGIKYTVLRYPNVYGERQDPSGEAGVISILLGKLLCGEPVTINGDGEQTRDFVYVKDIAWANYMAATVKHICGVYNLGSQEPTSINELYRLLANMTAAKNDARHGDAIPGEARYLYLDAYKARSILGWTPRVNLTDGLRRTKEYILKEELKT